MLADAKTISEDICGSVAELNRWMAVANAREGSAENIFDQDESEPKKHEGIFLRSNRGIRLGSRRGCRPSVTATTQMIELIVLGRSASNEVKHA